MRAHTLVLSSRAPRTARPAASDDENSSPTQVKDDQGRRRLHGAFTGGFSAGYYNSVGSKEGWAPSTFVSSRNQRAQTAQKAEDFMDEEDLAAMREDQKLETREGFGPEGAKPKRAGDDRFVRAHPPPPPPRTIPCGLLTSQHTLFRDITATCQISCPLL